MKTTWLVFLFWIPLSVAAIAQDSTRVIAMENAWNQAELKNDASAVQLLLAEDFIMTTAEGDMYNKSQIVASIRDKSYSPDVLQSTDMKVHSHGSTAVVTGMYYEKGTDKGRPWERRGRFTDTWMFIDNRWQCVASHFSIKPK
jgi:ketosteroid isomerase-like protein